MANSNANPEVDLQSPHPVPRREPKLAISATKGRSRSLLIMSVLPTEANDIDRMPRL